MLGYALTIFTGAFLLFAVQPLMGKYILPWFGGGPGVWTTCLLFFQVVLLGGYAYAHLLSSRLRPRAQAVIHLALLAAALALLPITPGNSWKPHGSSQPTLHILALLTVCLGLPYFVLSSTGPLLQHWLTHTHPGRSPYRLYALSNAGSLLALLSYPLFLEACFTRKTQAALWGWGLAAYAAVCGWCAVKLWKAESRKQKAGDGPRTTDHGPQAAASSTLNPPPSAVLLRRTGQPSTLRSAATEDGSTLNYALWLLLPACASVLLLATTNKMCQDVAVIPFLWVLPLALYLLSFVICFDSPRWYARWPFGLALLAALGGICWVLSLRLNDGSIPVQLGVLAAGLFICCLVCHGELYRLRPDPRHLTSFYLMIATGGALGGLFVAVIAPLIFTDYFELHWGLFLCALLFLLVCARSAVSPRSSSSSSSPSILRLFSSTITRTTTRTRTKGEEATGPALSWLPVGAGAAGVLALGIGLWTLAHRDSNLRVFRSRNFYGVLSVQKLGEGDVSCYRLMHGRTAHGLQLADPERAMWPTLYYSPRSGVGLAVGTLPKRGRRIGVVGLGAGTLACYGRPGDQLRIYEINPEVERLARTWFSFLSHCPGKLEVVLGDARLSLEREPSQQFDLLVLDAFNSDAIPVHLLTKEAFAVYERHLATNGIIAVHVSNASLDLGPVVDNLAHHYGFMAAAIDNPGNPEERWVYPSEWMLLTRNQAIVNSPLIRAAARPSDTGVSRMPLWTDDFTSLFPIVRWSRGPKAKPGSGKEQVELAEGLLQQRDYAGAISRYRMALQAEPGLVPALNNLAWILATCPEAALRDGPEAVRLSEGACRLTQYKQTVMVGTLAAAYAEAGRFPEAVTTAENACSLATQAGEQELLAKNRDLLEQYRARRPYHEALSVPTTDGRR